MENNRRRGRDEWCRLLAMACSKCSLAVYSDSGEVKKERKAWDHGRASIESSMWRRRRGLSTVPPLCLQAKPRRVSATPLGPSYGLGHDAHASCPLEHVVAFGGRTAPRDTTTGPNRGTRCMRNCPWSFGHHRSCSSAVFFSRGSARGSSGACLAPCIIASDYLADSGIVGGIIIRASICVYARLQVFHSSSDRKWYSTTSPF